MFTTAAPIGSIIAAMSQAWGVVGHRLVSAVAARHLPASAPDFLRHATADLVTCGDLPDHWKIDELPTLRGAHQPDHSLALERLPVGDGTLPTDRWRFSEDLVRRGAGIPGWVAVSVGMLPYAIAETYEQLTAELAMWRAETSQHGADTPAAKALEHAAVHSAGLLGHYVGDAAQPLHTTLHYDGWDQSFEKRPEFSSKRGIHFRFETAYVNANVDEGLVEKRVREGQPLSGEPMDAAMGLIRDSHQHVEEIYRLDAAGAIDPEHPDDHTTQLAADRLAAGAQVLCDLWTSAWQQSEGLSHRLPTPQ
jgi:hypothetical protein